MTREELLESLGKVLAGLQVPYSFDPRVLGAAAEPWLKIKGEVTSFGWLTAEDFTGWLRLELGKPVVTDEMVAAFKQGWEALDSSAKDHGEELFPGARTRAGLQAAMRTVE